MTERMLKNRIDKLDEIAIQQKALEAQAEAIRNEIKADMQAKGVEEITVFGRVARWKEVVTNRLDTKALKTEKPDTYKAYCKESKCKRFTIA